MGNEHFWQVPRAQGVYARSITRHARRERSARVLPADEPHSGFTRYVYMRFLLMILCPCFGAPTVHYAALSGFFLIT